MADARPGTLSSQERRASRQLHLLAVLSPVIVVTNIVTVPSTSLSSVDLKTTYRGVALAEALKCCKATEHEYVAHSALFCRASLAKFSLSRLL
jgi:hypothetical protein